jgi:uncharacterized membrane protein
MVVLGFINVFLAGLLAGAEIVVRYGVRGPITVLDEQPQIQLRQALVRSLRVVVPGIFVPTALSAIAVTVVGRADPGAGWRYAGLVALLAWALITFARTVPINKDLLTWRPDAPPANWRRLIDHWERLNTARTWAAVLTFALFLTAIGLQLR